MTSWITVWLQRTSASEIRAPVQNAVMVTCMYAAVYIALDWVSFVQAIPSVGFTPWNPPPAASLALLILKGLRFAPALFAASVVSDGLIAGFPLGIQPTLASDAIVAMVYTGVAATLRRFAHADQGLARVADVGWLLLITGVGTVIAAVLVVTALAAMHGVPPDLRNVSFRHFFIGDLTGIVGLLPVFLTASEARGRWKEIPQATRSFDLAVFAVGLTVALLLVFRSPWSKELELFYLLLLPVVWIGVRHGLPWCAMVIFVEQSALVFTISLLDYTKEDFLGYQILSLSIASTGLILGAVVTERQRAERHLRQQQAEFSRIARVTTAGVLGASVVHEISQPLATIATYTHVCSRLLRSEPIDLELLGRTMASAESHVRRAGEIVERLRNFLGGTELRWSTIDLADAVRRVVGALADDAECVGVHVRIDERPLPRIAADRVQIELALTNLIRNAIEAVAECPDDRERQVQVRLRHIAGEVQVEVHDNGCGVSSDIAERLFEPFETSKQHGLGLGLSLSREIVKAHGGSLRWDATVTTGARFVLRLPCDIEQRL
jgi:two-component system sensor kinase FixL